MNSVPALTDLTPAQRRELLNMVRARNLVGDRPELPPMAPSPDANPHHLLAVLDELSDEELDRLLGAQPEEPEIAMTVPSESAGTLSRSEKQELLRKILLEKIGRKRTAPTSFAQERLWFINRLEPGSTVYNISVAWRLAGALDQAALERSLSEIVRRHEALRTAFAEVDDSPVQVIAPFTGFTLSVEDLSGLGEAAVVRRAGEEARRAFDLLAGPLLRATLLRLDAEEHVLLLSVHHIVSDGMSMGVLYQELSALYAAYREGRTSPLPELAVQYADYAAWQREHLRDDVLEAKLAYWRERLADAPALLELPTDHPRPAVQTYGGAYQRIELPLDLLERLQALGRSESATLYMTLLAAFQVLLGKYSGSDDIVVGSPIAGRPRKEFEETMGFFVNTVVLRTDLSGNPGFREVLRRAREVTLGAYEHQDVPFEKLVAELAPERSLSHTPLFQVMFAQQNAVERGVALAGVEASEVEAERKSAEFDLLLTAKATARGLRVGLNYSTDLFERGTAERMLGHLARVLEQVAADPDVRLSRLELLSAEERGLVVEEWNRTAAEYPADRCIHELFEAQAARTPDATAVRFAGAALTYATLDGAANRLANHLRRRGVRPETRVGICLERGTELVVAILAVLKAGGAYVPLDPAYPAERLAFMLADSGAPLLLTRSPLPEGLPPDAAGVICLDADRERIEAESTRAPAAGVLPGNLAYVIYTSGSTGRPKGVLVPHRGLANVARGHARDLGVKAGDRVLQFASPSFDASVAEMVMALAGGATLVLGTRETLAPGPDLLRLLHDEEVTVATLPPSALAVLPAAGLPALRTLMTAGEACTAEVVERWAPGRRFFNLYGPTEATIWSATAACAPGGGRPPIGRPVANTHAYVLDARGAPVPVGVPGELYVGGAGVSRGYAGRPGLTAERFVPDAFGGEPGARLYRTGDRVRWSARGELEFLGRVDAQVKVRGFRIEPGEIEGALRRSEGVADCVVVAREDVPGETRLVAYVVGDVEAGALREHLLRELPEYMVPSAFAFLDALPLTPNGKVDRKALPAPDSAPAEERYVAPRTPTEEVLAGIWAETLRLERVGVTESFFALGGHSLLATLMVARVQQVFGVVEVPLRAIFDEPTVAELAVRVEEMRRAGLPVLPPVVPAARTGALPLSFAQERLWFIDRMEPGSAVYNIPVARRLGGALDESALERAVGEIVRRHEALRTVFAEVDGSPVQVVAPFGGFALPVEDLSGLGEADREAAVRRRAREEAARPFDLSAGPLFRAALLRLGEEEHVLLLSMHHAVSDGWSMGVLFRELSALYEAYREARESPLPELTVQYADYAAWQREQLAGEVLDRRLAYWLERLAGAPELLELPTDHPRPPVQTFRGAHERIELPLELLDRLQALGRSEGATLYMTLLSAFQVLLSKYSGSEDIVVGSPIAGRTRKEVEELIGFFVNTLVLRTDLSGDPSFRQLLGRVREVTLGAYEHQEVPFERLVAELQPERSLSHSPLFQVMLTLQDAGGRGGALPGLEMSGVEADLATAKFDLSLTLAATAQGLRGALNYSTDLFERGTVQRMLGHLARVLEQVAADADVRLSRLELLGEAECALVLEEWNRTDAEYPADRCIHELFEAQAARSPDAVAVVFEDASLTYRELNERTNRLAHYLRRRGVGPEVRVGICMERSLELVVSLLGVLKAGGAYVPLDPAYPAERLAFTLADSGVASLLTQESLRSALPVADGVTVVSVDGAAAGIAAESAENPARAAVPRSLAYLIYTSGSTGVPKGVAIEHASAVALLSWADTVFTAEELSGVLAATSICFDLSVFELFLPLACGGCVIVVENALALPRSPAADRVRLVNTVPSAIVALLKSGAIPSGVRTVNLAGEPLRAEVVDALYARGGIERVYDLYGPSEDTTYSTWTLRRAGGPTTIGRPISNSTAYVLGAGSQPLPAGVPGELCLGGRGLARGYLGRPGQTAERFVPDPFSGEPGARLYRTGDRARWRADGTLEFLGRLDFQVKVRGFRIELGEIEAALRGHESVADCVVMARAEAGEQRLVAYVVGGVETDTLRAHVRRSLPEYMVPAAFVFLDALPLTANGKLDRKALPAPDLASGEDRYVAPRTPAEEVLAGIWAEVLRLERVGVEESFFDLGGHSLLATRVVSRIRELFGVEVPLRALFEGPTVAELAGRVEEIRRAGLPVLPPVVPTGRTGALPLSFAQERLWFIDRLEPGSDVYNIPVARRLGGALDGAALERALGEIVRRHEALRTVFMEVDRSPVQVVAPFGGFALPVEDLSGLGDADREAAVRRRAGEEARRPFDLSAGPLFRAALLRLGEEDHVLLLSMHHIVSDGWSTGVLFRELSSLYSAYREGRESPLPALAVQYADYAVWQREQLEGEALDRQLAYWRERLAGAPELLELPMDHPRPAVQSFRGAHERIELPGELMQRLQALGRSEGATLYMVLLGAFQVLLSKYGGGEDIVVGSPIAGRTRREVEELIGFFVNTLVLRADLSGDPGFREVLRRVREVTLGAYEHQEVPFEKLVAELQPERSLSHSPLFQVMFALQDTDGGGGALPGLSVSGVAVELASAKFDLALVLTATAHGLRGGVTYSTDLFGRGTIVRMLGHLERVLEQVAADADVRLSELELLAAEEREQVLRAWNDTERGTSGPPAHALFAEWARRAPEAVALLDGRDAVTYGALDRRAEILARHLRDLGVGPETPVGLCMERTPELLVGVLGIWKAGGAYVPLDPGYPAERLAWIITDAALPVVVATGGTAGVLPEHGATLVRVDRLPDTASETASDAAPEVPASAAGLAYVIYTSGSTGRPKGVLVQHGSLSNLLAATREAFGVVERDVMPALASYAFDIWLFEALLPLTSGAAVRLVERERVLDVPALVEEIADATLVHAVPALMRQLVQAERETPRLSRLRRAFVGGDRVPADLLAEMRETLSRAEAHVLYGPTEGTILASAHPVPKDGIVEGHPIGRPLGNVRLYVRDAFGSPQPAGVPGELLIGGAGVARGYLGRPGLTAERFVPDPFGGQPGARLYRTGDRARWRTGGMLEFLGRLDGQVKIRGFRIEPGEIEAVLRGHESVTDCVVVAREDVPGDLRLVAYVVGDVEAEVLREHLRQLPDYMVPGAFVVLEALPLTPNGKLDRKALPAPELASPEDRYVAPRTPVEEVLAEIWAEVLRRDRVGVHDSFFDLGGHSLLIMRLIAEIHATFDLEISIRTVFSMRTLEAMAGEIERRIYEDAATMSEYEAEQLAQSNPVAGV